MNEAKPRTSTKWLRLSPLEIALFVAACGGSGTPTPVPLPISVSVSSASSIVQANATVQLQAAVKNSSNQEVTWAVTQPAGTGSITPMGLYSAPAIVDETMDVEITATSVADPTKSASLKIIAFAAPAIAIRQNNGRGELYTTRDAVTFVPRGNNYLHFNPSMVRVLYGSIGYGRSTLNSTLYDSVRTEQAMAEMEVQGYNVVRTFLDILQVGDIGNDSGPGLSKQYVANLADFMTRAKTHHIYVLPIFEELPMAGGYRDFITAISRLISGPTIFNS